jgi:predicted nucleic acid-binding protein
VATIFLDTSALVRRYDPAEPGSGAVQALCDPAFGNGIVIVRLTPIEVSAAFNRKYRMGSFDKKALDAAWDVFVFHSEQQYRMIELVDEILEIAETLPFQHNLRAYDSIQVASAVWAKDLFAGIDPDFRFCTADTTQGAAAQAEGLRVQLIR